MLANTLEPMNTDNTQYKRNCCIKCVKPKKNPAVLLGARGPDLGDEFCDC